MAKGRFDNEIPDLAYRLDHNDDDDEEETEANTTRPFQPGASSTPYHGGEQIEMHAMSQEQSGLPETDFDGNILCLKVSYMKMTNQQCMTEPGILLKENVRKWT